MAGQSRAGQGRGLLQRCMMRFWRGWVRYGVVRGGTGFEVGKVDDLRGA